MQMTPEDLSETMIWYCVMVLGCCVFSSGMLRLIMIVGVPCFDNG